MLKKFLGIFQRDKSGFSNQELEWQQGIGTVLRAVVITILVLTIATGEGVIWNGLADLMVDNIANRTLGIILLFLEFIMLFGVVNLVIILFIGISTKKAVKAREIQFQLQKNLKEEKTRKCLSCVKEQDFSTLEMEPAMINELFRKLLQSGIMEMELFDNKIRVSLSDSIKNVEPFFIKEELLTYFNIEEK